MQNKKKNRGLFFRKKNKVSNMSLEEKGEKDFTKTNFHEES